MKRLLMVFALILAGCAPVVEMVQNNKVRLFFTAAFMSLRSPTEDENGDMSLGRIWTLFPLMGKGRDWGAREPIKQSPLPLSFPVGDCVAIELIGSTSDHEQLPSRCSENPPLSPFEKKGEFLTTSSNS
jgi:hypothetical protein